MNEQACNELEKLASDAIARLGQLETENAELKEQNRKMAAAVRTPSDEVVEKALDGLLKSGGILPEQVEATRTAFKCDPDAAFRAIAGLTLDGMSQVKTATNEEAIRGGSVVSVSGGNSADYLDECADRMLRILNKR